jgi:hypothetical protein
VSGPHAHRQAEQVARLFSLHERHMALHRAHSLLRTAWRHGQVPMLVSQGPNELQAIAIHEYPGVNTVRLSFTGELVARSLPGRPLALVPSLFGRCSWCELPGYCTCRSAHGCQAPDPELPSSMYPTR